MDNDFHLHNSFCYWINRLNSTLQERLSSQLSSYDLTWSQWSVMNILSHNMANTPAEIAHHVGVDRSAITRLLDRLEQKEYIERSHDKIDRRSVKVCLTASGQKMMGVVNKIAREHQEQFLSDLHRSEQRGLKGELQKMLRTQGIDTFDIWQRTN